MKLKIPRPTYLLPIVALCSAPAFSQTQQEPALIGPEIENQLAVNYMHYMGSGNFAGIRYGKGAGERGAWAAGIRYLNYGSFDA